MSAAPTMIMLTCCCVIGCSSVDRLAFPRRSAAWDRRCQENWVRADGIRAGQAAATRKLIITTARRLFSKQGYNASPIEQIVEEARITRGALYHHFQDKRDLFRAVFHAVELDLAAP